MEIGVKLGPLEIRILEEVWARRSVTARELVDDGKFHLAYTTIMTTLNRLFKKGLLKRILVKRELTPRLTAMRRRSFRLALIRAISLFASRSIRNLDDQMVCPSQRLPIQRML